MKQKTPYTEPEIDFIKLQNGDILTLSGVDIKEDLGENDGEWL